jgi:hypothetical protein
MFEHDFLVPFHIYYNCVAHCFEEAFFKCLTKVFVKKTFNLSMFSYPS